VSIIRKGPWKLIEFLESDETELYHLESDPGETRNLASTKPTIADNLSVELRQWKSDVRADPMTPNPDFRR
jgi:arylsulfatase A-like enzyme